MLTTKLPGDGRRVDPAAVVGLDLQAGLLLLQEKGHEPGILVGADALIALARRAAGVADDLDERVRRRRVDRLEDVLGLFERGGERAQHSDGERGDLILIGEKRRLELRERRRPLVRALQARPGRRLAVEGQRRPFRPDVDLLAPVGLAAGMLEAGAVVAAEMRRVHHFDGELVLLGQREEASGDLQHVLNEAVLDPVADQIEEADAPGRRAQFAQERRPLGAVCAKAAKVERGKDFKLGRDGHKGSARIASCSRS